MFLLVAILIISPLPVDMVTRNLLPMDTAIASLRRADAGRKSDVLQHMTPMGISLVTLTKELLFAPNIECKLKQ